ncbi:hypothetical protein L596_023782 [Steinernema carpocapsae]|uniref:Homeobox domain-containing protein n=1 Tax=Steinernema carpocapsae TaxID=34508 RepID=A0A4U5MEP1_STECR|nr:hypothetical protein L596_023782 [Steinernema carpocapsae]
MCPGIAVSQLGVSVESDERSAPKTWNEGDSRCEAKKSNFCSEALNRSNMSASMSPENRLGSPSIEDEANDHEVRSDKENSPEALQGQAEDGGVDRKRHRYTDAQTTILNALFEKKQRVTREERLQVAKAIGLTDHQVSKWFTNKRLSLKVKGSEPKKRKLNEVAEVEVPLMDEAEFQLNEKALKEGEEELRTMQQVLEMNAVWLLLLQSRIQIDAVIPEAVSVTPKRKKKHQEAQGGADNPEEIQQLLDLTAGTPSSAKFSRKKFSKEQVTMLQKALEETDNPDVEQRREITKKTGLNDTQVAKWFQNRRYEKLRLEANPEGEKEDSPKSD